MCDINHMTAGKAAFRANAAEEEHPVHQITASLDNLANTLIQKKTAINNLVASNAQFAQALQDMQAAMVCMFPSGQAHFSPNQALMRWPTPLAAVAVPPAAPPAPALVTTGL